MINHKAGLIFLLGTLHLALTLNIADNEVMIDTGRKISNADQLLTAVVDECFIGDGKDESSTTFINKRVLEYFDAGIVDEGKPRSLNGDDANAMVLDRVSRFLNTHQFKVQLPEFLFQDAVLTFRPSRGLGDFDVEFPMVNPNEDRSYVEARGMLKKKLLLPALLLLKLKLKALTPLLVALIGVKALKALILSKLAIFLVMGFIIMQLCKKAGMSMPMAMTMEPAPPTPAYGTPPTMMYGAPAPSPPSSSYEPGWEPAGSGSNGGGPYSRVWDPHQVAYSSYYTTSQQVNQGQETV